MLEILNTTVYRRPNVWARMPAVRLEEENAVVRDHLRERGRAVVLRSTARGEMLTLLEHRRETRLLRTDEISATLGGRVQVNIANALAASAAAVACDVPLECIRDALRSFTTDFEQTPGRFNLLDLDGRQVVVDYAHNVAGLEAIAEFVRRMEARQSLGVVAIAGDRRDEDIRAIGELAGRIFDRVVIREHDDPRGRQRGEVAQILRAAAIVGGLPAERTTIVLDEVEAVHAAIDIAVPGDLVMALVDRIPVVWESLLQRARDSPHSVRTEAPALVG